MRSREYFQPFRLAEAARKHLLDRLDATSAAARRTPSRKAPRYQYREPEIPLLVGHPGGSFGRFLVCSRNLSAGGVSFLHGGYLHLGTRLALTLTAVDGESHVVLGEVVNARFVVSMLHEINVAFDAEIDPTRFPVGLGDGADTLASAASNESVSLPELEGSVVCVGDKSLELSQIASVLRATGLSVDECTTTGATLDRIKLGRVDLLLTETRVDGVPVSTLISRARADAYRGPIMCLLRAGGSPEAPAGTVAAVGHPLDPVLLLTIAETEIRRRHGRLESIRPALPPDGDIRSAAAFARWSHEARTLLSLAVVQGHRDEVLEIAGRLREGGQRHGYAPIADAATQVVDGCRDLDEGRTPRREIAQLIRLCGCVVPPTEGDATQATAAAA